MKCLLIETKDKRKFFTHEKNFIQLIEFSKAFNAEISTVKIDKAPILELEELAPAICDANYKKCNVEYSVIESKLHECKKIENLSIAKTIRNYIFEEFKNKKTVSLASVKKQFEKQKISDATIYSHIRHVRLELEKQGYELTKERAGHYRIK
jgi:hypothetical protein